MTGPLDAARWERVEALFAEVIELAPEERAAFLDRKAADAEVRREVEGLLGFAEKTGAGRVDEIVEGAAQELDALEQLPTGARLGPYRLVEEIGRGGMGVVYLAVRDGEDFDQRVAVKLLPGALFDDRLTWRFRNERRILSSLEHPGVARFLDGGTTSGGVPYVVMEYVDGEPIDEYCRRHALGLDARLALFSRVCDAVRYAHGKLVVHRDLKPANILVDGEGQPKLLDFGIARLIDPDADATDRTATRIMTPRFASPEQVAGRVMTTATDVYSLGALLYLVLSGRNAHGDVSSASELARRVAEDDPVPPSEAAGNPALRGDLDTIVLTAMRRDPEDRYTSVDRLQQDIEAYRTSEPIAARPSTLGYRARKFAARNRAAVMGAAVALLAVVGGGTAATVGLVRALAAETEAREEARVAEEVTEFLVGLFEDPAPAVSQGEERTARELLDRGVERIGDQLEGQPAVQARLRYTMGRSYAALGDRQRAVSLYTIAAAGLSPDQEELLATIRVAQGASLRASGQPDDAIQVLEQVVAATAPRVDTTDAESLGRTEVLSHALTTAIQEIGVSLAMKGAYDAALDTLEFAHRLRGRLTASSKDDIATTTDALAYGYQMAGRTDEAIPHLANSLELNAEHGEKHPSYLLALSNLAGAYARAGRFEEARGAFERLIPLQDEVLGPRHPSVAQTLSNYGTMFIDEGRPEDAEPYLRRALEIYEDRFGPDNPAITTSLHNLALVHQLAGDWAEAERLYQRAADIRRSAFGADSPRYAAVLLGVGVARLNQENWAGAAEAYAEAIAILRAQGPVHQQALADYAQVLRALGRDSEAEEVEREAEANADPGSG